MAENPVPPWAELLEVGSTAIPDVIGKGDLDILVRVPAVHFDEARTRIDALFPRNTNQLSCDDFQGYVVPSALDVAVQLTVRDGPFDDFEAFLRTLRADARLVAQYNALKRNWDGQPMEEYRTAKDSFIEQVLGQAQPCPR